jgi:hypothetical protein
MKKNIVYVLLILVFSSNCLYSQTDFYEKGTVNIKLFGGRTTGSSFFDLEGNVQTKINYFGADTISFTYDEYTYGIRAEYSFTDKLTLYTEIPLKYYTLLEKKDTTVFDDDGNQYTSKLNSGDFSLFQPAYYSIGAKYLLYKKFAYFGLLSELRIPPGFYDGIQKDPDYEFLSDGALELHGGMLLGVKFARSWMESLILYKFRGEELSDLLFIHTEIGLSTVPGTKLLGFFDFTQSFGSFENAVKFDPRKTTIIENNFDVGVYFSIFVTDNLYGEFSYKVNLLGKNTMNVGGYLVGIGVKL